MKKLAVAIPTYMRPKLLIHCLKALVKQCTLHDVDIHVFDDSCSNINQWVYKLLTPDYPCIHIHINKVNLGIDRNIDQCISTPAADYVWMIGEDDLVCDGSIATILDELAAYQPLYLFVNYQYISNDYSTKLHIAVPISNDGWLQAGDFFGKFGWATGFLGANVVNKSYWDVNCMGYMGTYFNHVGKIFSQLETCDQVRMVARPLVYNRAESLDSFTWLKDCFEVNAGFGKMLGILCSQNTLWYSYCKSALNEFEKRIDVRNLKSTLVLRAHGIYNIEKYRFYMSSLPFSMMYLIVAVAPISMLSFLYHWYKIFRKRSFIF